MKTAKVKAQELYPDESGFDGFTFDSRNEKSHFSERQAYIKGYDTAIQDFLEKACKWLKDNIPSSDLEHKVYNCFSKEQKSNLIKRFKNYIKNERL